MPGSGDPCTTPDRGPMHPLKTAHVLWRSLRPSFLLLTPVCVGLGLAAVPSPPAWPLAALILLGALTAHAAVNVLNEYQDFRSGLDRQTVRTPFSGGSGALPAYPTAAPAVGALAAGLLAATAAIGIALLLNAGGWLLFPGLAGLGLIVSYTHWLNRSPLLCLMAPGIGFGPIIVLGSELAASGATSAAGWFASSLPLFLGSGLLLLNQLPDLDADARVGRNHWAIHYGPAASARVYAGLVIAAAATLLIGIVVGALPPAALLALMPFPLAWPAWRAARQFQERIGQAQPRALAMNVTLTLLAPLLLTLGLTLD